MGCIHSLFMVIWCCYCCYFTLGSFTMTVATDTLTPPVRSLNAQDRCDRCGARAYILMQMPSGFDLMFCNHHGSSHSPALMAQGAVVLVDNVHALTKE